jgi:4-hydroxybenzoate polyprenyltransferase
MVWNDYFDQEIDRRERPERPLPSGRVTPGQAAALGGGLMVLGLALAVLAGLLLPEWSARPGVLALLLVGAIFLYDGALKYTGVGPVSMGLCRLLNVLLGLSLATAGLKGAHLAATVGIYIAGVTWFARTEARASSRIELGAAAFVMLGSLVLALALPLHFPPGTASPFFPYLLVALGFALALPILQALSTPTPACVQAAVKRSLFCLIVLDAILATAAVGTLGLVLLVLLLPSLYLNRRRWLYAT